MLATHLNEWEKIVVDIVDDGFEITLDEKNIIILFKGKEIKVARKINKSGEYSNKLFLGADSDVIFKKVDNE